MDRSNAGPLLVDKNEKFAYVYTYNYGYCLRKIDLTAGTEEIIAGIEGQGGAVDGALGVSKLYLLWVIWYLIKMKNTYIGLNESRFNKKNRISN